MLVCICGILKDGNCADFWDRIEFWIKLSAEPAEKE